MTVTKAKIAPQTKTRIQRMTSKGQVTMPAAWRRGVSTSHVSVKPMKGGIFVSPAHIEEEEDGEWTTVFSAKRDNGGKSIPIDEFSALLTKIKHERDNKTRKTSTRSLKKRI